MPRSPDQILTVGQMRAAEDALIGAGVSVDDLMQRAGRGAAEYVWRVAAGRPVTVLCGPGNNGGDGYVIAEALRERGQPVVVVASAAPKTDAARGASALYKGELAPSSPRGEVLVDCLFGSGLTRPLPPDLYRLLCELALHHRHRIAVDLPSGIDSDTGRPLNAGLPSYDLTVALGTWKFAHFLMPACAAMGAVRLVDIGIQPVEGAARVLSAPALRAPDADAHKYRRGLLAVVGGDMPGAAVLAATAAQGAGAGYVKLFVPSAQGVPADLVVDTGKLSAVLTDDRNTAILVGPGLGRRAEARERLTTALADDVPTVVDADALLLLGERQLRERTAPVIATPHDRELRVLEGTFGVESAGSKVERARMLANKSGLIVVAKGPDTVIAAPDGRAVCAPRPSSWLSAAGSGDVLAGIIASRLAAGSEAFAAACEGIWLQGEAARLCGPAFSASRLAAAVPQALAAAL